MGEPDFSVFVWPRRFVGFGVTERLRRHPAAKDLLRLPARLRAWLTFVMALPYHIATLLYVFNDQGEVLLLERTRPPNQGLWSPCGGKLHTADGESPYACACREAEEEVGMKLNPTDLHLTGLISEHGYEGQSHWLMFLFEIKPKLNVLPKQHREGRFEFVSPQELMTKNLPKTDRDMIWPLFWAHRGGFFSAHCRCHANGQFAWTVEEKVEWTIDE